MVFQDPMTSLNPAFTIGTQLVDTIRLHRTMSKARGACPRPRAARAGRASPTPSAGCSDYPHQLSGGMRQRALLALALSCEPRLLIADEPTTALDVTVQAQILDLLRSLQERLGMAVDLRDPRPRRRRRPLLARDRDVRGPGGRGGAGRGAVRPAAPPVHRGPARGDPAVRAWRASAWRRSRAWCPRADRDAHRCRFHPRCPYAVAECETVAGRADVGAGDGHRTRCIRVGELTLEGAR